MLICFQEEWRYSKTGPMSQFETEGGQKLEKLSQCCLWMIPLNLPSHVAPSLG